ncbi:alpha-1,3-arabinosyltransferase XAT2-like [Punica granatum]|uniref:Alpha-1,3-arabinosyltransferase XAT2-like n=1 Tax=Punica granatum TaxID=22663 RepID=A0A6P8C4T0_PUNGR|nr:alpha-1,3-arabinosyltransferase XAT2-like [Punica granatum]
MREAHELKVANVKEIKKPKLMLISWRGTQKILNERVLVQLMEQVGFQVVVADDKTILSLEHFVEIVNSCSVLVRVQGAGLAHELFLPDGSVLVRIVLLGMEWNAETYFGGPGTTMGFRHLEYKISPKESSILQMYSTDHLVITEPESVLAKGFEAARAVDFDKQDVKIDLFRFKKTLVKALKLVGH